MTPVKEYSENSRDKEAGQEMSGRSVSDYATQQDLISGVRRR